MKAPYVGELEPNKIITTSFLVHVKEIRQKKSGEYYLSLTLGDRTGDLDAKMLDNVNDVLDAFERDDFVKVKGLLQIFQNRPQLTIHKMVRILDSDVDFADYFPASERDPLEMFAELRQIVSTVANAHLRSLLNAFLDDEDIARRYRTAPAAKNVHHAYLGGLIELETVVGRGTTVSIWLPKSGATALSVPEESTRELPRGDGEAVLVVDDEAPLVGVTEEMLAELGYHPIGIVSSPEALQMFRDNPLNRAVHDLALGGVRVRQPSFELALSRKPRALRNVDVDALSRGRCAAETIGRFNTASRGEENGDDQGNESHVLLLEWFALPSRIWTHPTATSRNGILLSVPRGLAENRA